MTSELEVLLGIGINSLKQFAVNKGRKVKYIEEESKQLGKVDVWQLHQSFFLPFKLLKSSPENQMSTFI